MELIDREKLLEKLCDMRFEITKHRGGYQYLRDYEKEQYENIEKMEDMIKDELVIEDVVPVKRGRWLKQDGYTECSECKYWYDSTENEDIGDRPNYCPNCGSRNKN